MYCLLLRNPRFSPAALPPALSQHGTQRTFRNQSGGAYLADPADPDWSSLFLSSRRIGVFCAEKKRIPYTLDPLVLWQTPHYMWSLPFCSGLDGLDSDFLVTYGPSHHNTLGCGINGRTPLAAAHTTARSSNAAQKLCSTAAPGQQSDNHTDTSK